jgi:hypothetical protein
MRRVYQAAISFLLSSIIASIALNQYVYAQGEGQAMVPVILNHLAQELDIAVNEDAASGLAEWYIFMVTPNEPKILRTWRYQNKKIEELPANPDPQTAFRIVYSSGQKGNILPTKKPHSYFFCLYRIEDQIYAEIKTNTNMLEVKVELFKISQDKHGNLELKFIRAL